MVYGRCWLRAGEPVHYIKQVSYVSGEPVSQEETYIPEALLPNLKQVDLGVFSVYEALEFYGIRVARREQSLEITELDPMDARAPERRAGPRRAGPQQCQLR